jgi:hypothetical protein
MSADCSLQIAEKSTSFWRSNFGEGHLKMKDFVTSIAFSEEQVCSRTFLRDFTAACRKMSPLVEFTTGAQVYLLFIEGTL